MVIGWVLRPPLRNGRAAFGRSACRSGGGTIGCRMSQVRCIGRTGGEPRWPRGARLFRRGNDSAPQSVPAQATATARTFASRRRPGAPSLRTNRFRRLGVAALAATVGDPRARVLMSSRALSAR